MTRQELREHYAGLAMQSMMISDSWNDLTKEEYAKFAVIYADALLAEVQCKHEMKYTVHGVTHCSHCHQIILPEQPQIT